MERICRAAGMRPAKRLKVHGVDVYIADGFSAIPHVTFQRFGITDPAEFPYGAYATFFFTEGLPKGKNGGMPLFFNALDAKSRNELARMNATEAEAVKFITARKKPH